MNRKQAAKIIGKKFGGKNKGKGIYPRHEGGTFVYYLPEEHYVGITNAWTFGMRMSAHRCSGKNIDGWKILFHSQDRKEAKIVEGQFHFILGCDGANLNQ